MIEPILLKPVQVAERLQIPVATLAVWRHRKQGPPSIHVGRLIRYRASDVEVWLRSRTDAHE